MLELVFCIVNLALLTVLSETLRRKLVRHAGDIGANACGIAVNTAAIDALRKRLDSADTQIEELRKASSPAKKEPAKKLVKVKKEKKK